MPETMAIRPADLILDENNPRLPEANEGQRAALRAMALKQQQKILSLAKDILQNGLSPAELLIVMAVPVKDERTRYRVLEGNRRLTALRALENPEIFLGAFDDRVLKEMRALSGQYQEAPVESVSCMVVRDREEADHWITLRHTGQNNGVGIMPWGSDESARYRARFGDIELHSQVLNWMESEGKLTTDERSNIPVTTLKRLLGTPEVREKLGIDLRKGSMVLVGEPGPVARAVRYVIRDLTVGPNPTRVKDVYTKPQRIKYAKSLPKSIVVKPAATHGGKPVPNRKKKAVKKRVARAKAREVLIPYDCVLEIPAGRIQLIEGELRSLDIVHYANAAAVLFRVFVELSVDNYIAAGKLPRVKDPTLRAKIQAVVEDLQSRSKLTKAQAVPVRRSLQKDSFLAASASLMNQYVHNEHVFPSGADLRSGWDNLQPFLVALWSA